MRFIILSALTFVSVLCFSQSQVETLAAAIDAKVETSQYMHSVLPDSLNEAVCRAVIYFDASGLHKLEAGCGDVTLEMTDRHYYFSQGELVYALLEHRTFNAPPTFTEEIAKREGAETWFDPKKTKISRIETYFSKGKMTKMIDNGKDVATSYTVAQKTETIVLGEAKQAMDHYNLIKLQR
jgi:hypothetical protein